MNPLARQTSTRSLSLRVCAYVRAYVRTYVRASVGLCSALWKNGGLDADGVWHHRSDGSRDEAGSAILGLVHGKGHFWGEFGARHCYQWGLYGVRVRQRRYAALSPNYFGQTCYDLPCYLAVSISDVTLLPTSLPRITTSLTT